MMKALLRRKWFRILVRSLVVVASLLFLAVAVFNWHAAGQKKRAIAEAKAAGLALSANDLMAGMPPDELNFSRHGIFALMEDGFALPEEKRSKEQKEAIASFTALRDEALLYNLIRQQEELAGQAKISIDPQFDSYGKTSASFLAEFDRRHRATLDWIRSGMSLPYVHRRALPKGFAGGTDWIVLDETYGALILTTQRGLQNRLEAALATGDSARAAESIEMSCRLGELIGSSGFLISTLMEFATLRTIKDQVKSGMNQERWTVESLDRISAAVAREDVRTRMIRTTVTEAAMVQVFEAWKQDRERIESHPGAGFVGGETRVSRFIARLTANISPDGLFDRAAAVQLDELRLIHTLLHSPTPAAGWWSAADDLRGKSEGRTEISRLLNGTPAVAAFLKIGSRTLAHRQLILTACALERHRLTHGSYPESLAGFPAEITTDPILGGTLHYERTGNSFQLHTPGPPLGNTDGKPNAHAKDWVW